MKDQSKYGDNLPKNFVKPKGSRQNSLAVLTQFALASLFSRHHHL